MRWLAIFDNVDDYNILRDNIPSEDKGCILITSNRKPELGITAVEKMEVEVFPETEASAFMVSLMKEAMDNSPGKATLIPDPTDPGLKKLGNNSFSNSKAQDHTFLPHSSILFSTLSPFFFSLFFFSFHVLCVRVCVFLAFLT